MPASANVGRGRVGRRGRPGRVRAGERGEQRRTDVGRRCTAATRRAGRTRPSRWPAARPTGRSPAPSTTRPWPSSRVALARRSQPCRRRPRRARRSSAAAPARSSPGPAAPGGVPPPPRRRGRAPARSPWYSVASSRLSPEAKVLRRSCTSSERSAARPASAPTRRTSRTRTPRRAARRPRRSTWLFADEPRLREGGQPPLVAPDLVHGHRVVLEQRRRAGPAVEQPADPDPRQQPDAQLDPADPVHAAHRRIGRPPRLAGASATAVRVPLVTGQPRRRRPAR